MLRQETFVGIRSGAAVPSKDTEVRVAHERGRVTGRSREAPEASQTSQRFPDEVPVTVTLEGPHAVATSPAS